MYTIPITHQLIDFALYDGEFSSRHVKQMFYDRHKSIEQRRKTMNQSEFLSSLSKYDKLIYQTYAKSLGLILLHFFIFAIYLIIFITVIKISLSLLMSIFLTLLMVVFLILSYQYLKFKMIKKVMLNDIIEHDIHLFLRIANRAYYNKDTEQILFNYQLLSHEDSQYDQFVVHKLKKFIDASAIRNVHLRKEVSHSLEDKKLTRENLSQYILIQLDLIEKSKHIEPAFLYNGDYIELLKSLDKE